MPPGGRLFFCRPDADAAYAGAMPDLAVTPADVARHYDELDPFYRELWGEHVHHGYWTSRGETAAAATENLVTLVAERLALRPGALVGDIGCG